MTRLLCTTALLSALPSLALAQDQILRADITEAVVYAAGAEVTREITVSLPAGQSNLFIAMPDVPMAARVQISGPDGVRFGPPQRVNGTALEDGQLDTAAQASARQAVEEAEAALFATQDDIARSETTIRAIEAQLAYLNALTRGEGGVDMPDDPALVPQFLATIGAEMQRVSEELVATRALRRELAEDLADGQAALEMAETALAQLRPYGEAVDGIEVLATTAAETEAVLEITYLTEGVYWEPSYDLRLDSETGRLDVDRFVTLALDTLARWQDVQVTFSTSNPNLQRAPQDVWSRPARIREEPDMEVMGSATLERVAPAPLMEPVIIMEDTATLVLDGLSVSYAYGAPVSVSLSGEVVLPFETLALDTETEARAAPRFDETAFLVATGDNTSGEAILPGEARFFRDGALVGTEYIDLIPPGAELELAFGALEHLQLIWIDRSLAEGDRGVFVTSNTQERALAFGVENIGDSPETVRLIYATPFAEQEDLDLQLTLSRDPDERDVEDRRGVHAWQVDVAPGATELIEMQAEFRWPDGQILDWRP